MHGIHSHFFLDILGYGHAEKEARMWGRRGTRVVECKIFTEILSSQNIFRRSHLG